MIQAVETGRWCGPSALSLLTGRPYPETTSLLAFIRDQPYSEIEGVWNEECLLALHTLGFTATPIELQRRYSKVPTLQRYMCERPSSEKVEPTLIQIYGHFIVGHFDFLADNGNPQPVIYHQFPRPRRKVENVFIIRRRIT